MHFMKLLSAGVLLSASILGLNAQNKVTVRGTVTAADTKEPLIGAYVVAAPTTSGVLTDLDGKYELAVADGTELTY